MTLMHPSGGRGEKGENKGRGPIRRSQSKKYWLGAERQKQGGRLEHLCRDRPGLVHDVKLSGHVMLNETEGAR